MIQFPKPEKPRRYEDTLRLYEEGMLTCGFLWAVAAHDEVFAAKLRRLNVPRE